MVVEAQTVQMDSQALSSVERLFWEQIDGGSHPGAALAVYRYGQPVLDLWGGLSDGDSGKPIAQDTLYLIFASTKPLTAASLHVLWERGDLGWDDPVARYWPEFAQNGKGGVTVRHILTHQGGFPDLPKELTWDKWNDWGAVLLAMEMATPIYEPGTVIAHHSHNFGWVVAELVRRIDSRPFTRFMQEEITGPLGMLDTYFGIPPQLEDRVSKVHAMEDCDRLELVATFNRPEVHGAVHPGAGTISTARDVARFYALLERGGTLDGVQIMKPETVAEVTALQVEGTDPVQNLYVRRSLGLLLADDRMGSSRTDDIRSFGHGGTGTSVVWADADSGLAMAYITNGHRANPTNRPRLAAVSQAVRDACV